MLDEIQKVHDWPGTVKMLWDADTHAGTPLKVVLLGSSPLLIQSGLTESLAGRFEILPAPHWSYGELREAFGWNVEEYVFHGASPVWKPSPASRNPDANSWSAAKGFPSRNSFPDQRAIGWIEPGNGGWIRRWPMTQIGRELKRDRLVTVG